VTPRWRGWLLSGLALAVIVAAIYFPTLRRRVQRAARLQQQSEEQARRELTLTLPANPGQPRVKTKLFWASSTGDDGLAPTTVELPLSDDPVLRAKQVLNTLLAGPVDTELRTLPPDAALLEFYLLPDGTGVADFSEALATSTPSGIQSEQLAVDSIARTLEADVPQVQRMKILIHGQEMETLAGHLDLMGTFVVNTKPSQAAEKLAQTPAPPGSQPPRTGAPASNKAPAAAPTAVPPGKLTPGSAPGKLAQPEHKP
jgi:spore germination protein GerM